MAPSKTFQHGLPELFPTYADHQIQGAKSLLWYVEDQHFQKRYVIPDRASPREYNMGFPATLEVFGGGRPPSTLVGSTPPLRTAIPPHDGPSLPPRVPGDDLPAGRSCRPGRPPPPPRRRSSSAQGDGLPPRRQWQWPRNSGPALFKVTQKTPRSQIHLGQSALEQVALG